MEQIMGQIEQDLLYGDDPPAPGATPPAAPSHPAVKVSPTGVITRGPKPPAGTPPAVMPKPGALKSVVDLLTKPAGPLPVWGWGALTVVAAAGMTTAIAVTRKPY